MAATAGSALVSRRNLRLASGLTLFSYAGLHLVNHALGLHSLAAAEAMLAVAVRVWSSVPTMPSVGTFTAAICSGVTA